jgi:hypothetical protein
MVVNLKVQNEPYKNAILKFIDFERVSVAIGLRIQAARLGDRLVKFTPPKSESQGKDAVERDIRRVYGPLDYRKFSDPVRRIIKSRNYTALQKIIDKIKKGPLVGKRVIQFAASLHRAAQDRRGRVKEELQNVTPDFNLVRDYIKRIQKNVGQARGGWAASVFALGRRVNTGLGYAGWVSRHANAGRVIDDADDLVNPSVTLLNESEWAGSGDQDRVVAGAIRARTRDILSYIAKTQQQNIARAKLN